MQTTTTHANALTHIMKKGVDNCNFKIMLRRNTTVDASQNNVSELNGTEESGFGWPTGGQPLSGVTTTQISTDDVEINADNISVTADGGTIAATSAILIEDDGVDPILIRSLDFGEELDAQDSSPFIVKIPYIVNTQNPA